MSYKLVYIVFFINKLNFMIKDKGLFEILLTCSNLYDIIYYREGIMIKHTEIYRYAEDSAHIIEKEFTKVMQEDGRTDIYRDTYITDKETGERRRVEHISDHASGLKNHDYISENFETHIHGQKDGSQKVFDRNPITGERDYTPYEK